MEQTEKLKITQKEFEEMYSIIEEDTPQPDLDKLTENKPDEPEFLTEEEQQHDADLHQDLPQEEEK